jgi:hypothetical protein
MNTTAPVSEAVAMPGTSDANEFQLPVAGLFADLELGSASIRLPDEFLRSPGLVQLRVLDGWQRAMLRYRRAALQRFADDLARGAPSLDGAGRDALLRSTCEALNIDVPGDFAASAHCP